MARPRKPTRILELTGRLRHDPARGRARAGEPKNNAPLGEPSPHLSPTATAVWREILATLVPGVALESDRTSFELLVRLVGMGRRRFLPANELALLVRLCGLFGMTPADRSRVSVPRDSREPNPFAKLG